MQKTTGSSWRATSWTTWSTARCGDGDDFVIHVRELCEGLGEDFGVGFLADRLGVAGFGVVGPEAVKFLLGVDGGLEAAAFLRDGVEDDGLIEGLEELQGLDEHRHVVPVDGTVVAEAELFEDHAATNDAFGGLFGFARNVAGRLAAEFFEQAGGAVVETDVRGVGGDLVEVLGDGADVFVDRPLVVVEDDDHALGLRGDVVEGFKADAVGEGGIAGEGDDVLVSAGHIAADGHAEGGAKGGTGVSGAEGIVLAFGAEHEAVEAAGLADGFELLLAAGEEFVDVALVADVEDEAVLRRVEDVVHGDGEFDDTEVRADVSASFCDAQNQPLADFFRKPFQLHHAKPLYIFRRLDLVQILTHSSNPSSCPDHRPPVSHSKPVYQLRPAN
jgi:hypothetical protein